MFKNYMMTAFRNLIKSKLYSIINISGLAVSLSAVMLITAFVCYEFDFDQSWQDGERIYRLTNDITVAGHPTVPDVQTPPPIVPAMGENFPGVDAAARTYTSRTVLGEGDDIFYEGITYVDPPFLRILGPRMIAGIADLGAPDTVILSQSLAIKLYGDADPIGTQLSIGESDEQALTVVGIMADIPEQSHLRPVALAAFDSASNRVTRFQERWNITIVQVYLKLNEGADPIMVHRDLQALINRLRPPNNETVNYNLQPLSDIHLHSARYAEGVARGDIETVTGFSIVAFLTLIIAGMNYTNLSTARALRRAREVGVRKTLGAGRSHIIIQFTGESFLISLVALVIAFVLTEMMLAPFAAFVERPLNVFLLQDPGLIAIGMVSATVVAIGAAIYPAFVLSSFDPAKVLKGEEIKLQGIGLRSLLVVLQFAISIILISSALVVAGQMRHLYSMPLGYDREGVIVLSGLPRGEAAQGNALLETIRSLPGVLSATTAGNIPTRVPESYSGIKLNREGPALSMANFNISAGYLELFDVPILAGRTFDAAREVDFVRFNSAGEVEPDSAAVLNHTGARYLGFERPSDAIGEILLFDGIENARQTIIGVIDDVRFGSAKDSVRATVYYSQPSNHPYLVVKVAEAGIAETTARIEEQWRRFLPDIPVQLSYLEDQYQALYETEGRQATMLIVFAGLAIFVSCLGLYALAALAAEQRYKEVGIRRVLGAGLFDILRLLLWQFTKPVLIAGMIAGPIAWLLMRDWLDGFMVRIALTPEPLVIAAIAALMIAWATTAGHAFNVARSNPIHALRYE